MLFQQQRWLFSHLKGRWGAIDNLTRIWYRPIVLWWMPKFTKKETLPFTFSWFSHCVWKCSKWKSTIVPKCNSVIPRPHLRVLLIAANFSRLFDFILMFHFILREITSLMIEYCSGYSYKMKGKCIWHNYNFTSLACESVIHDVFKFRALNSFIHVKMYSWKQMQNIKTHEFGKKECWFTCIVVFYKLIQGANLTANHNFASVALIFLRFQTFCCRLILETLLYLMYFDSYKYYFEQMQISRTWRMWIFGL